MITVDDKFRKSVLFLFACLLAFFSVLSGCQKNPPLRSKTAEQFDASEFVQFTRQLRARPVSERQAAVERFLSDHPASPLIEHDSIASFLWLGRAHDVFINGDLQGGWSRPDAMDPIPCGHDTLFVKTYRIPPDARLDYLFVVDGKETIDPRNRRITPSGYGPHSEVAMPGFISNPARYTRPDVRRGKVDTLTFASRDTSIKPRRAMVYKPARYEHLSGLPTLYVHDGPEAMEWMSYPTVLDNLIGDGKIEPVLVVFIPSIERVAEQLEEKHHQFISALCDELVPLIDRTYRTDSRPQRRAMAGISSGAHLSLLTVLSRPEVFLFGGGQSSGITDELFHALRSWLKTDRAYPAFRLYFDVGRYDLVKGALEGHTLLEANEQFHQEMEQHGFKHVFHIFNDGHQWANWRERTEEILVYFFGVTRTIDGPARPGASS